MRNNEKEKLKNQGKWEDEILLAKVKGCISGRNLSNTKEELRTEKYPSPK